MAYICSTIGCDGTGECFSVGDVDYYYCLECALDEGLISDDEYDDLRSDGIDFSEEDGILPEEDNLPE
jgi:hypothetical protein